MSPPFYTASFTHYTPGRHKMLGHQKSSTRWSRRVPSFFILQPWVFRSVLGSTNNFENTPQIHLRSSVRWSDAFFSPANFPVIENITSSLSKKTINTLFPGTPKNHFLYWLFQLDDFTLKMATFFWLFGFSRFSLKHVLPRKKFNSLKFSEILQINAPTQIQITSAGCCASLVGRQGGVWFLIVVGGRSFSVFFRRGHGRWPIKNMFYILYPPWN